MLLHCCGIAGSSSNTHFNIWGDITFSLGAASWTKSVSAEYNYESEKASERDQEGASSVTPDLLQWQFSLPLNLTELALLHLGDSSSLPPVPSPIDNSDPCVHCVGDVGKASTVLLSVPRDSETRLLYCRCHQCTQWPERQGICCVTGQGSAPANC